MMRDGGGSVVPAEVQEVLDLFEGDLVEVRFPDIDVDVLTAHAAIVEERLQEMEAKRAEYEEARSGFEEAQAALRAKAERGLAYARVFVNGDQALEERLGAFTLGAEPPAKSKKPRRKRKAKATSKGSAEKLSDEIASRMEELPFAEASAA